MDPVYELSSAIGHDSVLLSPIPCINLLLFSFLLQTEEDYIPYPSVHEVRAASGGPYTIFSLQYLIQDNGGH